jgi:uncharacterized protein with NRDE domain
MCVIFFAFERHHDHPLIVLANRDEFYDRPTEPAHRWKDRPDIIAGRDLVAGGTWLGVTDGGRFAAVTNYREPASSPGPVSRGSLVRNFLESATSAERYMHAIESRCCDYSGFNLLAGELGPRRRELYYYSNRGPGVQRLEPGIYGLSNHLLDTAWPKVANGTRRFAELVSGGNIAIEDCFRLLADETLAADGDLPDTGVGLDRERVLSPIFVSTPVYGTRGSTVVMRNNDLTWKFEERVFACTG